MSMAATAMAFWIYAVIPNPVPVNLTAMGGWFFYGLFPVVVGLLALITVPPNRSDLLGCSCSASLVLLLGAFNYLCLVDGFFFETKSFWDGIEHTFGLLWIAMKACGLGALVLFFIAACVYSDEPDAVEEEPAT